MWRSEKSVNAQFVVDCIEEWMPEKLVKPRVLAYSPHLNLIETLWRKMKYEWLKPEDYASFEKLTEAVKKILN